MTSTSVVLPAEAEAPDAAGAHPPPSHQAPPPPPPPPPPDFAHQRPTTLPCGTSYTLSCSPAHDGAHLAFIYCVATFPATPPASVFALFTHPGACGAGVWRDVKALTHRTMEADAVPGAPGDPPGSLGVRSVLVTQVGEVRLAVKALRFETHLRVVEDARGAGAGTFYTHFSLARPGGALRRFHGTWALRPGGQGGAGTVALLTQDVCPAGCPPGVNHVPVVGRLVRGACARAVRRMVEDLAAALAGAEAGGGVDAWVAGRTKA